MMSCSAMSRYVIVVAWEKLFGGFLLFFGIIYLLLLLLLFLLLWSRYICIYLYYMPGEGINGLSVWKAQFMFENENEML